MDSVITFSSAFQKTFDSKDYLILKLFDFKNEHVSGCQNTFDIVLLRG